MRSEFRFRVQAPEYSDSFDLYAWQRLENGKIAVAQPVAMQIVEDGLVASGPMLRISHMDNPRGALRNLMDELWKMGIRPSEELDADVSNKHLEDMRRLVFDHWLKR